MRSTLSRTLAILLAANTARAQQPPDASDSPSHPVLRFFRSDEDWSALADSRLRTDPFDPIKYIPLSESNPDAYLSIGGELRLQPESYTPPDLGTTPVRRDDYWLTRVELHADAHFSRHVRTFVELIHGRALDAEIEPPANQQNGVDLQQAFVDIEDDSDATWRVRAGRMEMGFGSYRLISPREGTNLRIAYDGLRASLRTGRASLDAFVTRPVAQETGVFDDASDPDRFFFGLYGVVPASRSETLGFDAYYLGLLDEDANYGDANGTEERHSIGVRFWGRPHRFDFDVEVLWQFGRFTDQEIRAWTIASSSGMRLGTDPNSPRIGLKANIASGDRDASDGTLSTFNPLFPRNSYFSEASLVSPSNFYDVQPLVQFFPSESTKITLAADAFFRYSAHDAVYAPGGPVIDADVGGSGLVGTTGSILFEWQIGVHTSFSTSFVHFWAGDVVRAANGDDVDFATASLAFRF